MDHGEPVSRPARFLRGWAAAGVCILCAATSHYAVDPRPPSVLLLAVAFALAALVCVLLAGRRMGPLRTGCAVLLSQVPFHLIFSGGGHSPSPASSPVPASPLEVSAPRHAHHAATVPPGHGGGDLAGAAARSHNTAVAHAGGLTDLLTAGHAPMLWAHLAAAAVTFVLLRHVEDGWWRLLDAAVRVVFTALRLLRPVLVPCHGLRPVPLAYLLPPRTWSPVRVISRRGPPLLSI